LLRRNERDDEKYEREGHAIILSSVDAQPGKSVALYPGFGAHRELHALALSGIPPAALLEIGAIDGAGAMNVASSLGTLEPGKIANDAQPSRSASIGSMRVARRAGM
jgi:imidazolonepropionase-like amidohydrolase